MQLRGRDKYKNAGNKDVTYSLVTGSQNNLAWKRS